MNILIKFELQLFFIFLLKSAPAMIQFYSICRTKSLEAIITLLVYHSSVHQERMQGYAMMELIILIYRQCYALEQA